MEVVIMNCRRASINLYIFFNSYLRELNRKILLRGQKIFTLRFCLFILLCSSRAFHLRYDSFRNVHTMNGICFNIEMVEKLTVKIDICFARRIARRVLGDFFRSLHWKIHQFSSWSFINNV